MEINFKVYIAVTNNILFDQRAQRIATALNEIGFECKIIGRKYLLPKQEGNQKINMHRLHCFFNKGVLFYLEYNIRLFIYLISKRPEIIYACDPDTLLACTTYKRLFNKKGVYDSHEYFIETPELNSRKGIKWIWDKIERFGSRNMNLHITVNDILATLLSKRLGRQFYSIRNLPFKIPPSESNFRENIILYQGVLNEGRGLKEAIDLIGLLPKYELWLAGEGDLSEDLRNYANKKSYKQKIKFLGKVHPEELKSITNKARYGYNLLNGSSLNYYYSLANKFFDYMAAGVPSINMNFPVYDSYIKKYHCGISVDELKAETLAKKIQSIDQNPNDYKLLQMNSYKAHVELNWEIEKLKLAELFRAIT